MFGICKYDLVENDINFFDIKMNSLWKEYK